eukprot:TRINITY_DN5760_c0_g1_i1.p1 TRINITY_DN5760_c0_g1~~TRINITY_DN5760_c0_g1_i1.p1  ORF type:complete len:980 (+),score=168.69 TRINITY_DN5760_c0_g1_i1:136-3075(+)
MHNKKMATTWSKSTCTGSLPKPRCSHASCIVDGKLLISGGWMSGSRFLNDIHIYHIDSSTWSQPVTSGDFNTPRVGHTMTPVENRVFIFGGSDGYRAFNDLQIFDLETMKWSTAIVKGNLPESRSRHTATRIGVDIYVFGGGDNVHLYNDLYVLNTETLEWTLVKTRGMSPSCRWGHTTTLVDHKLYVFGGHDGQRRLNDVHVLNLETLTWTQPGMRKKKKKLLALPNSANSNGASTTSSSSSLSSSSASSSPPASAPATPIKIFDGGIPPPPPLPRPKTVEAPAESQPLLSSSGLISAGSSPESPNSTSSSISSTDSNGNPSCPVTPPTSPASAVAAPVEGPVTPVQPPPRAGHTAALYGRKIIIYGGGDGKLLGDMYYLNVDTLQWFSMESGNVPDRCAHTCDVFEAVDSTGASNTKLLVFGGSNGIKTFNDLYTVAIGKHKLRRSSNSTPLAASGTNGKKTDFAQLAPSQEAQTAMAPTGIPPPPPIPASSVSATSVNETRSNSLSTRRFGGVTQKAQQLAAAAAAAAAAQNSSSSSTSMLSSSAEISSNGMISSPSQSGPGSRANRRSLQLSRDQVPIAQSPGQSSPASSSPSSNQSSSNGSASTPASPRTPPTVPSIPVASLAAAAANSQPFTPNTSVNSSSTVRVLNRDRRNSGKEKDLNLPANYPTQNGAIPATSLPSRSNPTSPRIAAPSPQVGRPTTPPHQPPSFPPLSAEPLSSAISPEMSMLVQLQMQTQQLLQHSIMQQQQLQHRLQEQMTLQQQQQTAQLQILQHLVTSLDRIRSNPSPPQPSPRSQGHSNTAAHQQPASSSSDSNESKLRQFLEKAGLAKYRQNFAQHDIAFDQIPMISDKDLQQIGLSFMRDRVLFFKARNETFGHPRSPLSSSGEPSPYGESSMMGGVHQIYPPYLPYASPYGMMYPPPHQAASPEFVHTITRSLESLKSATTALKQTVETVMGSSGSSQFPLSSSSSSSSSN